MSAERMGNLFAALPNRWRCIACPVYHKIVAAAFTNKIGKSYPTKRVEGVQTTFRDGCAIVTCDKPPTFAIDDVAKRVSGQLLDDPDPNCVYNFELSPRKQR